MSYWYFILGLVFVIAIFFIFFASSYVIGKFVQREKKQSFARFLLRCAVFFGLLYGGEQALQMLFPSVHLLLQDSAASLVVSILHLGHADASVRGTSILLGSQPLAFEITVACLGGVLLWAYVALVFAQPGATPKQRLLGILVGLATLVAFNIFRITLSVYLQERTGVRVHDYFYWFNMLFVLLVWAGWLRTLKPRTSLPVRTLS